MTHEFIHRYWQDQAARHGASHEASWGDTWMIALEIENIGRRLRDGDAVLDVGCGNGYAAFQQLARHRLSRIVGLDFASKMVEVAARSAAELGHDDRVEFVEGDVRSLPFPDHAFDVVYTTRVLINLPSWQDQSAGIRECVRVAKPGGRIVLSEAFWEPLVLLNALRALKGLPPLVEHDFNRYLKKAPLEAFLRDAGLAFEVDEFSSVYYLGSRFLRELVTDASAYPGYGNPVNRAFYELEKQFDGGGFGIQQAYVIEKPVL